MNSEIGLNQQFSPQNLLQTTKKNQIFPDNLIQEDSRDHFQQLQTEPPEDGPLFSDGVLVTLEDGLLTKFYFRRMLLLDQACLFFALLGLVLSVLYYDADFDQKQVYVVQTLLWLIFLASLIQIVITYFLYLAKLEVMKAQQDAERDSTLRSRGMHYYLIKEWLWILLQPYPFLNDNYYETLEMQDEIAFNFKINHLLCILILCRIFIIIRVFLQRSQYSTPRSVRLGKMYGCETGYLFTIKSLFKDYPLSTITITFFFQMFYFGWALRIAEKPVGDLLTQGKNSNTNMNFSNYWNSIWCIVITMTTIGYGDYSPRTIIGRILIVFISIWGIFTVSMMVVVLSNTFAMNALEKRALNVLKCLAEKVTLKEKAAFIVTLTAKLQQKYSTQKRKQGRQLVEAIKLEMMKKKELKQHTQSFSQIRRMIRFLHEKDDFQDQMARMFEQLREDLKSLVDNQERLRSYIEREFDETLNENVRRVVREKQKHAESI